MSLNTHEVEQYIKKYVKDYSINKHLHFKVRDTGAELYGEDASEKYKMSKASYKPYHSEVEGRYGRIDVVANNNYSLLDLRRSLNHEIIGHYGLNTLNPQDKKLLLDSIINNKENLSDLWDSIDRFYADEPLYLKAEEVFCLIAEDIDPSMHRGKEIAGYDLNNLTVDSLKNIALMIAEGISLGNIQKTFFYEDITHIQWQQAKQQEQAVEIDIEDDDLER